MIIESKNCINFFTNFSDIKKRYPKINKWIISDVSWDERLEKLENSTLFKELTSNISENKKYSNKDILSWIDSLSLIYRIFESQNLNEEIRRDAKLIQEYSIPYTRNNRCDFLLIKDNKICILEFTFKISSYLVKAQQCFTYKQILQQFLPANIEIISYVFSYTSENKEDHVKLDSQIKQCTDFLNFFFNSGKALDELNKIKDFDE